MHILAALAALPASVNVNGEYSSPDPLPTTVTLLLFVGIPLLVVAVVAALTLPQGKGKAVAYRPGRPWAHPIVWFGTEPPAHTEAPRVGVPGVGGSSARW